MQGQDSKQLHALLERFDKREEKLLDALPLDKEERIKLGKELKYLREVRDQRIDKLLLLQEPSSGSAGDSPGEPRKRKRRASTIDRNSSKGKRRETGHAYDLPPELWCQIFSFLSRKQLLAASLVSTVWRSLALHQFQHVNLSLVKFSPPEEVFRKKFIFACKNLPSLRSLNLTGWGSRGIKDIGSMLAYLPSSSLFHLYLDNTPFLEDKYLPLLPSSLRTLSLSHCNISSRGLKYLCTPHPLHAPTSPSLRSDSDEDLPLIPMTEPSDWIPGQPLPTPFPQLQTLNLSYCPNITNHGLKYLRGLTSLTSLDLCSPSFRVTSEGLKSLPSSLRSLDISYMDKLTDEGIKALRAVCPDLQVLNISKCNKVTNDGMRFLPAKLRTIFLSHCYNITDEGIANLAAAVPLLENFHFSYSSLTDDGVRHLPRALKAINLSFCPKLTNEGMRHLPPHLHTLLLSYSYKITDDGLRALPPSITTLKLSRFFEITDDGLQHLPPALRSLDLSLCDRVSDQGMARLPPTLAELNLSRCDGITDAGVAQLPRSLGKLDLSFTKHVTDACLRSLPKALTSLNLSSCPEITGEALADLPLSLSHLFLSHCEKVTDKIFTALPRPLETLDISSCSGVVEKYLLDNCVA